MHILTIINITFFIIYDFLIKKYSNITVQISRMIYIFLFLIQNSIQQYELS